jgi:ketosteroid isomerase-like protein
MTHDDRDSRAQIETRIRAYLDILERKRDAEAARDFYTDETRLIGPGFELDREAVARQIQGVFDAGAEIRVNRETLELFLHGEVAYELAKAEDSIVFPDGSSQELRNHLFIRWERGADGNWRFARALLSPLEGAAEPEG